MLLSILFQLYRGGQFYWRMKPEYPKKTILHNIKKCILVILI